MPTPVEAARQCLTPEAARALDDAVSVARRRGHAQITSLHAVSALLSLPSSSILRDACGRARNFAYSPRLQFKALDLCLSLSLDRVPSAAPQLSGDPPVSNSLMAAIRRSQAHQRRQPENFFLLQQQQQQNSSVSCVKVELQHLILSILDDPVVSRVFAESGFRSSEIKLAILRPLPQLLLRYPHSPRGSPVFLCNLTEYPPDQPSRNFPFPFSGFCDGEEENYRRIGEVLSRRSGGRNPLLLGACACDTLRSFTEAVEKRKHGVLPVELSGLRVICIEKDVSKFVTENCDGEAMSSRFKEIAEMAEQCTGAGVVVNFGDVKSFVSDENASGSKEAVSLSYVVAQLAKLLQLNYGKFWLMGAAASYESYLKFVGRFPSVEKDWDLQLLPIITSVPPSMAAESYQRPRSRCEREVPSALKERFSASAADDPYPSNLPPWLQNAEFGTAKGWDIKLKDNGVQVDSSESGSPHKKLDNIHQRLHQQFPDANNCSTVMGFQCSDNKKEDADNNSNKISDTSSSEYINHSSQVPAGVQMTSTSQSSSPFPVVKANQEKYTSKLSEMFQKAEGRRSVDLRSCNMSNSSACDGSRMSPPSVTSVTTDLGLGICSSHSRNKSIGQYIIQPPKEIPSCFSSNFNLTDGNILKHPSQSSTRISFDYLGQVDARNPKILFEALSKEVSWQDEALRVIIKTIACSQTKRVKHQRANQRGDVWMNFVGPDSHGKKKIAVSLAEFLYGSRDGFIFVDLSSEEMKGCNVKFRGKTTVDFIVGEYCKKPLSVVFLENVDKADMLTQNCLSQAIKTGKITDSNGREVSVNNAIFVTSFSGQQNSSKPTREPSNYSEERIVRTKGGPIKIKVEHVIGDIRSQSLVLANRSIEVPNPVVVNKRKLTGDNEFHDQHLISDTAKRAHTASNWLLDLNLPAELNELQHVDGQNSEHVSIESQNLWLQDLYDQVDETVAFKPYNFDALADRVLKVITSSFHKILGSECALQIQSEVMDQLLAAAYVSDRDMEVENWVVQVLSEGFTEVQRRYNLTARSIVKLATCPKQDQASSVYLPPSIIVD